MRLIDDILLMRRFSRMSRRKKAAVKRGEQGVLLLYRRRELGIGSIDQFVDALFQEIAVDSLYLDFIQTALRSAGFTPSSDHSECKSFHGEETTARLNDLAEVLYERLRQERRVRRAIRAVVGNVLRRTTAPPPGRHLSESERAALAACHSPDASATHIEDYDTYEAHQAHVSICLFCRP